MWWKLRWDASSRQIMLVLWKGVTEVRYRGREVLLCPSRVAIPYLEKRSEKPGTRAWRAGAKLDTVSAAHSHPYITTLPFSSCCFADGKLS